MGSQLVEERPAKPTAAVTLPNFLVVGTMRGGTTTLGTVLNEHPEVFVHPKELHFFDHESNYSYGMGRYAEYFAGAIGSAAVGEKTPSYCFCPVVAERIKRHLPQARLIWLLRDPVERTYSHYWHGIAAGKEFRSFEGALSAEKRLKPEVSARRYVGRGVYVEQVERYLQHFPREQMLFVLHEDLKVDPENVLQTICRFLKVDESYSFLSARLHRNIPKVPRSVWVNYAACTLFRSRGARALRAVQRWNEKPGRYPPMNPETRGELTRFFAPHNDRLAALLGLDLSRWSGERGADSRERLR
jgi:hypothetical protein